MTPTEQRILAAFPTPPEEVWGAELVRRTRIWASSVYSALARLQRAGLVLPRWETADEHDPVCRPRRMYVLTAAGLKEHYRQAPRTRTIVESTRPEFDVFLCRTIAEATHQTNNYHSDTWHPAKSDSALVQYLTEGLRANQVVAIVNVDRVDEMSRRRTRCTPGSSEASESS